MNVLVCSLADQSQVDSICYNSSALKEFLLAQYSG